MVETISGQKSRHGRESKGCKSSKNGRDSKDGKESRKARDKKGGKDRMAETVKVEKKVKLV